MAASKAQMAATAKRRAQAIELSIAGMDNTTIAERLGYNGGRGAVSKDIRRALDANRIEEARMVEELRYLEGLRLDRLQVAVWPKALKGDLKAVETVRRLIAERIRLRGVAEPVRTELSGPGGSALALTTGSIEELDQLLALAGQPHPGVEDVDDVEGDGDDSP